MKESMQIVIIDGFDFLLMRKFGILKFHFNFFLDLGGLKGGERGVQRIIIRGFPFLLTCSKSSFLKIFCSS